MTIMSDFNHEAFGMGESVQIGREFVEPNRRLIPASSPFGIEEFVDRKTGERHIAIPSGSALVDAHRELAKKHVPVFPIGEISESQILLDTPSDARILKGSLKFIARDIPGYREIFGQVGELFGRCQAGGFGLPGNRIGTTVLESIAFSTSDEVYGSSVYMIPPYTFDASIGKQDALDMVRKDLTSSSYLSRAQAAELQRAMDEGWNALRH